MASKTIGITEEVYERLRARKRTGESFTELVDRLLDETTPDWEEGFGTLDQAEMTELEEAIRTSRFELDAGLRRRQEAIANAIEELDETP